MASVIMSSLYQRRLQEKPVQAPCPLPLMVRKKQQHFYPRQKRIRDVGSTAGFKYRKNVDNVDNVNNQQNVNTVDNIDMSIMSIMSIMFIMIKRHQRCR